MPNQWNAVIATQTALFRGTSTVGVKGTNQNFPSARSLASAVYGLNVTGGVSGSFSVMVVGNIGGYSYYLAGISAVSAAGNYILQPIGYSSANGLPITPPLAPTVDMAGINRLDMIVPPSSVQFAPGVLTAGISAACTVSACFSVY